MSPQRDRAAVDTAVATVVEVSGALSREGGATLAPAVVADLVRMHGAALRLEQLLALLLQDRAPLPELFARTGVRHELNTPLTIMIGYSDLLLEEETTPDFVSRLERVREAARIIFRVVNGTPAQADAAPTGGVFPRMADEIAIEHSPEEL